MTFPRLHFLGLSIVAAGFALTPAHLCANDFTAQLNALWKANDATQVLIYVESERNSHPTDPQILTARAIVTANLEQWLRGATNQLQQAMALTSASTNYTSSRKQAITQEVAQLQGIFAALADDLDEPTNSAAAWNPQIHSELFGEIGDEFPYLSVLEQYDVHE